MIRHIFRIYYCLLNYPRVTLSWLSSGIRHIYPLHIEHIMCVKIGLWNGTEFWVRSTCCNNVFQTGLTRNNFVGYTMNHSDNVRKLCSRTICKDSLSIASKRNVCFIYCLLSSIAVHQFKNKSLTSFRTWSFCIRSMQILYILCSEVFFYICFV